MPTLLMQAGGGDHVVLGWDARTRGLQNSRWRVYQCTLNTSLSGGMELGGAFSGGVQSITTGQISIRPGR